MSDADIHAMAQLFGHKDLRMAARYQHLSLAFLQEAVGNLMWLSALRKSRIRLKIGKSITVASPGKKR